MSAHFESAISRLRPTAEPSARTTVVAIVAATHNGTSGVLACGKQARRQTMRATPRTGWGQSPAPVLPAGYGR